MNLTATSASATPTNNATAAASGGMQKVGELSVRWKPDEDLFLGGAVGPEHGFASFEDALSGAAGLSGEFGGGALAVREQHGRFQAHELLQPVWRKSFTRQHVDGYAPSQIVPLGSHGSDGEPKVGFSSFRVTSYGGRDDRQRTGQVVLDTQSGVDAIVGPTWAIVDGTLRDVRADRPDRPQRPTPPVDPMPPVNPGGRTLVEDVTEAARLATEALRIVGTIPPTDSGDASTKDVRIKAFQTNMAAQKRIEQQFDADNSQEVVSTLRSADASLEDANWQLAKKPSPDGRFNGVDIPGAARDTQRAVELLDGLLEQLNASTADTAAALEPVNDFETPVTGIF